MKAASFRCFFDDSLIIFGVSFTDQDEIGIPTGLPKSEDGAARAQNPKIVNSSYFSKELSVL